MLTSFNESYYRSKFERKRVEIANNLKENPADLTARKQLQFANSLLNNSDVVNDELSMSKEINWASVWQTWGKQNFLPYELYERRKW